MWRAVLGYEGRYEVSDEGQVRSLDLLDRMGRKRRGRMLSLCTDKRGYPATTLHADGLITAKRVHRLVLEAFVGPCPPGMEGCHNDGNTTNNHVSNLRWDTRAANEADKIAHGTYQLGDRNPNSRHDEATVRRVHALRKSGMKYSDIEKETGVRVQNAWMIVHGKSWKHLCDAGQ